MNIVIATLILWVSFISVMCIKKEYLEAKTKGTVFEKPLMLVVYPAGIAFVIFDIFFNYVYGSVLFFELPKHGHTLTSRLRYILHSNEYSSNSWRYRLALFMCQYMIEPWDVGHCSLGRLR